MSIKSVLVTGANRGIGLEFVKQLVGLAEPPHHIFASCRNPDKAEELQKIAKSKSCVHVIQLDVLNYDSFPLARQQIEDKVGQNGLNLLLNNAGILYSDSLKDVSRDHMMENFEANAVSPLLLTKELLPLLKAAANKSKGEGLSCSKAAVVNITSKMGSIDDNTSGGCYPYRASKTALNMIAKSLSVDLQPQGILVFNLHPGWVITDMGGKGAMITAETSVSEMLKAILEAGAERAGLMLNFDGKKISY